MTIAGRRAVDVRLHIPKVLALGKGKTNSPSPRSYVQDPGGEKGTLWYWPGDPAREEGAWARKGDLCE